MRMTRCQRCRHRPRLSDGQRLALWMVAVGYVAVGGLGVLLGYIGLYLYCLIGG